MGSILDPAPSAWQCSSAEHAFYYGHYSTEWRFCQIGQNICSGLAGAVQDRFVAVETCEVSQTSEVLVHQKPGFVQETGFLACLAYARACGIPLLLICYRKSTKNLPFIKVFFIFPLYNVAVKVHSGREAGLWRASVSCGALILPSRPTLRWGLTSTHEGFWPESTAALLSAPQVLLPIHAWQEDVSWPGFWFQNPATQRCTVAV